MAYATVTDIYNLGVHGGTTYTTTTTPTLAQVEAHLDFISNEINSKLYASGVKVPVIESESPEAFKLLKEANAYGTAARTEGVIFNEELGIPIKGFNPESFSNLYREKMDLYTRYPKYLRDAVLTNRHQNIITAEPDAMYSVVAEKYDYTTFDNQTSITPLFRMSDEF